ncbi:nuclear transport factor 2 family protein [Arcticibacterium luteifluviistationis]|uniref:Uncharacterized protein n=1 Tax=Arcticibacterium luteifluviistationis TaxID=1784714 RepID=A0A2Z4G7A9_9BACT|nr:nuclear transport factor 2 family protein [Arcticibacterium luteifluviistationis]AWV97086.1 hypothetical protein DJ013_02400 [Arcticibacterium luteifluviistationis]
MKQILLTATALLTISLTACNGQSVKPETEISNKDKVVALLKSIETGAQEPAAYINPNKYIQHNLGVADGLAGFGALLSQIPANSAKVNTIRAFQDGDYVFTQTDYNFFGPKIGFDIFKFEDGLIVEHWDNLQETPASLNPSGRSMVDGTTEIKDIAKTEENKKLVANFVDDILVKGDMSKLGGYFNGDNYLQHNPQIADGLSGLGSALEHMASQNIFMKFNTVHKVLGQGNFVLTISEGTFADQPTSFYDLFRVENGKIAEHWDVMETIIPESEWKNTNGKF